jgi:hypothetical protein
MLSHVGTGIVKRRTDQVLDVLLLSYHALKLPFLRFKRKSYSYMFMKLFQSLADRRVFDEQQTNRLTEIGQGLLLFTVLNAITKWMATEGASGYLESYGFIISESTEQNYNLSVSAPSSEVIMALTGLCILALAQVFKYGGQLQQENELTI